MWESRRDFQRGWEAGFLAFHAFHTLSFPWPAFRPGDAGFTASSTSAMGRTRKEVFVVIVVDEVAVGTIIADRPPHRSARALISACGSYLG
jgi:hypothetical protein